MSTSRWTTTSGSSATGNARSSSTAGSGPRPAGGGDAPCSSIRSTALTALGIDPATVTQLVVTHAHYDHIGNLQSFPAAEIVIARREFEFWTGPYAGRIQFAHSTEPDELDRLAAAAAQGRVRMVDETLDLAPGIELVVVGGHTPGQLVAQVAVHDEDGGPGAVILAADALHFYEELERDRPFFVVADLEAMYRGLRHAAGPHRRAGPGARGRVTTRTSGAPLPRPRAGLTG